MPVKNGNIKSGKNDHIIMFPDNFRKSHELSRHLFNLKKKRNPGSKSPRVEPARRFTEH